MTKILIIEDHRLVAEGLALGLGAEGFDVRTSSGDFGTARADLDAFRPDVVLLDLGLGEHGSGLDLLPELVAPGCHVVVLTGETDPSVLGTSFDLGATAVLDKAIPFPDLVEELHEVVRGGTVAAERRRREIQRDKRLLDAARERQLEPFAELSPREAAVLGMLMEGRQAADIAEASFVSLATVRTQIRAVLTKLGVTSQLAAVSMAVRAEWKPDHVE
ncbi:MAG: response regulator transcription factor [Acidimicrobiia bacterium]|nr:response regulator transcription factor [Acidimicrobiia bacterium]